MHKLPKPSFNECKSMKDEIIKISEQRFEIILARRLNEFKKEILEIVEKKFIDFKKDLLEIMDLKFGKIDEKFHTFEEKFHTIDEKFHTIDLRFDHVDRMFKMVFWILGVFITLYIASYSVLLNILLSR